MLVFTLFALINLCIGYAVAVLLGHGPDPWYAIFLPAAGNDVVQIDALEAESSDSAPGASENEPSAETPATVNYPFPEMNEPEDQPPKDAAADDEPFEQPDEERQLDANDEPASPDSDGDDDDDIEKFLAAGKRETVAEPSPATASAAEDDEALSSDDIAAIFAAQGDSEANETAEDVADEEPSAATESAAETEHEAETVAAPQAAAADDTETGEADTEEADTDATLDQDDIAALFNQV